MRSKLYLILIIIATLVLFVKLNKPKETTITVDIPTAKIETPRKSTFLKKCIQFKPVKKPVKEDEVYLDEYAVIDDATFD